MPTCCIRSPQGNWTLNWPYGAPGESVISQGNGGTGQSPIWGNGQQPTRCAHTSRPKVLASVASDQATIASCPSPGAVAANSWPPARPLTGCTGLAAAPLELKQTVNSLALEGPCGQSWYMAIAPPAPSGTAWAIAAQLSAGQPADPTGIWIGVGAEPDALVFQVTFPAPSIRFISSTGNGEAETNVSRQPACPSSRVAKLFVSIG